MLTSSFHTYGQYLAWHALGFVAARVLPQHPVCENWDQGQPWSEWISGKLLTRNDGLWLSDGMDRPPLGARVNALESGKEGLVLTGNRDKLMGLVGINGRSVGRDLVVEGDWESSDGVRVHVNSALGNGRKGRKLAKELLEGADAFSVWLPTLESYDDGLEHLRAESDEYKPWIVRPSIEGGELEKYDPLSLTSVERRPRFAAQIADHYSLASEDPFQRSWLMPRKGLVATTQAWGFEIPYERGETGTRLVCRTEFLSSVLEWTKSDLILLIKLSRYEEGDGIRKKSRFSNTVAVLRVRKDLKLEYFAGPVNQVHR